MLIYLYRFVAPDLFIVKFVGIYKRYVDKSKIETELKLMISRYYLQKKGVENRNGLCKGALAESIQILSNKYFKLNI